MRDRLMTDEPRKLLREAAAALKEAGAKDVHVFGSAATDGFCNGSSPGTILFRQGYPF